jgi:hypothetical protein
MARTDTEICNISAGHSTIQLEYAMPYRAMADLIVVIHLLIVGFVIGGGVIVWKWKRSALIHLPIVAWVIFAECFHKTCPLTYLENWCRERGSMDVYQGDFVAHYLMPVLYPDALTPTIQIFIGVGVLLVNVTLYVIAFTRKPKRTIADPNPAMAPH